MKTIELSKFTPNCGRRRSSDPFSMYFVYPRQGEPVIVKGMSEVDEYVERNYPESFYYYSFWKDGASRGGWRFTEAADGERYARKIDGRWQVKIYRDRKLVRTLSLRRMPHRWIPEFDV